MSAFLGAPVLALQVWDAFGWIGQALFTWRIVEQWLHSERAKQTVIPRAFWGTSLLGSLFRIVYDVYRREPVFLMSDLASGSVSSRNLWMTRRDPAAPEAGRKTLWPLLLGLLIFGLFVASTILDGKQRLRFDHDLPFLLAGFTGSALWSGRFVFQWYASERLGRSVLPASFFWMSLAGSILLFVYAVYRLDWVNMAAYAANPIPYVRNLILMRRHAKGTAP